MNFYTGFPNAEAFKMFYEFLQPKARRMHYWKGVRNTNKDLLSPRVLRNEPTLSLEQELLIIRMRLKVGLLVHDLALDLM